MIHGLPNANWFDPGNLSTADREMAIEKIIKRVHPPDGRRYRHYLRTVDDYTIRQIYMDAYRAAGNK
jgi:hypothetical protein